MPSSRNERAGAAASVAAWLGALAAAAASPAQAEGFTTFSSRGLPGSQGIDVRLAHPPAWKKVELQDEMALAEFRGPHGKLTAVLQLGRGGRRADLEALCRPERARTMLHDLAAREPGTRVTEVVARQHEGRPAFEVRYERRDGPAFLLVRSVIVCLKDTRLLVSCGATGERKPELAAIEPVCRQVLDSLTIAED